MHSFASIIYNLGIRPWGLTKRQDKHAYAWHLKVNLRLNHSIKARLGAGGTAILS